MTNCRDVELEFERCKRSEDTVDFHLRFGVGGVVIEVCSDASKTIHYIQYSARTLQALLFPESAIQERSRMQTFQQAERLCAG